MPEIILPSGGGSSLIVGTTVAAAGIYDQNGQAGILIPTCRGWASGTTGLTANRALFCRFVLSKNFTVTSIVFREQTGGTGNVDVGIYDSTMANKLGSSGSTSGKKGANTTQTVNLSATLALTAGTVYYAAFQTDTTDGNITVATFSNQTEQFFGTTAGTAEAMLKDVGSFPLPSSVTTPSSTTTAPLFALI